MRLVVPETITFTQSGFCPGCGHGLAVRLIAEVMEEMGLSEKLLAIVDVAQTFCFAGTFETHDQLDHMSITLLLKVRAAPCV